MLLFSGCKKDDPVIESQIAPGFSLAGTTWYFKNVEAVGVISGVETIDDDPNPTGLISFNEDDDRGYADFAINLLNRPYAKTEGFVWRRVSDNMFCLEGLDDGSRDMWTILIANDNILKASWELFFSDNNNAVITATLTPDP